MVQGKLQKRLLKQIKKQGRGANVVSFTEGDYIPRSSVNAKDKYKSRVTGLGPYLAVRAHPYFHVKHLVMDAELGEDALVAKRCA